MKHPTCTDILTLIVIGLILTIGLLGVILGFPGCTPSRELLPTEDTHIPVLQRGGHVMESGASYVETSVLCLHGQVVVVSTYGANITMAQLWESAEAPLRCGPTQAKD